MTAGGGTKKRCRAGTSASRPTARLVTTRVTMRISPPATEASGPVIAGCGALAALAPHLVRLDAEDLADAGAELLGLDDGLDEVVQVIDPAGAAHLVHGLEPRPAEADLAQDLRELVRQGVLVLVGDARQRGVEAEAGVDGDHEQVHGVRQALQ